MNPELQEIRDRLQQLEDDTASLRRQLRRAKQLVAACCVAILGISLVAAQDKQKPSPVEGSEFILRDEMGRSRGGLRIRNDEAMLILLGGAKSPALLMTAGKDAAGVMILDDQNRKRGVFAMDKDGRLALQLFDDKEVRRADLGAGRFSYGLRLFDPDTKQRIILSASKDGGALMFGDRTGAERATFGEIEGQSTLSLTDEKGQVFFRKP